MAAMLKIVKCDISATIWPILIKFGAAMHISHPILTGDKNRKIVISPKPFGRFWRNFAWWHILKLQRLPADQKIKLLKIQDGRQLPFLKSLNVISLQPFDWFWWNLVRRCILGHHIWWSTKNFKIQDGGRRPSWKYKKSWYLRNHLANFY